MKRPEKDRSFFEEAEMWLQMGKGVLNSYKYKKTSINKTSKKVFQRPGQSSELPTELTGVRYPLCVPGDLSDVFLCPRICTVFFKRSRKCKYFRSS
jgi:hypothetical protein